MQEYLPHIEALARQRDADELAATVRDSYPEGQWQFANGTESVTVELHVDGERFSRQWEVLLTNAKTGDRIAWRWLKPGDCSGMRVPPKVDRVRTGHSPQLIKSASKKSNDYNKTKFVYAVTGALSAVMIAAIASLFMAKDSPEYRHRTNDQRKTSPSIPLPRPAPELHGPGMLLPKNQRDRTNEDVRRFFKENIEW